MISLKLRNYFFSFCALTVIYNRFVDFLLLKKHLSLTSQHGFAFIFYHTRRCTFLLIETSIVVEIFEKRLLLLFQLLLL